MKKDLVDHLESQAIKETKAAEVSRAHRVQLAKRERMVCRVLMEKMAHLAFLESRVAPVRPGCPVLLVLREQRDYPAAQEQKVDLEQRGNLDLEVMSACLGPLDLWVSLVFLVSLVCRESLDLRATEGSEDQLGHREQPASLEAKEREGPSVCLAPRVSVEQRETRASKEKSGQRGALVTPESRDWPAKKAKRVCLVNLGPKDSKESGVTLDTMDPLEILANQETRDHQDCLVLGGLMENEEYPVCRAFRDHQDVMHLTSILLRLC